MNAEKIEEQCLGGVYRVRPFDTYGFSVAKTMSRIKSITTMRTQYGWIVRVEPTSDTSPVIYHGNGNNYTLAQAQEAMRVILLIIQSQGEDVAFKPQGGAK